MNGFVGVALLCAVLTVANATDCTVCFRGHCFATSSFYASTNKLSTGHMVIDYNSNILYHYNERINAINLDTNTITPVPVEGKGNYLAFDQDTGELYYYSNANFNNTIYKYQTKTGHTEVVTIPIAENKQPPLNMLIHNGSAYFNTHRDSGWDIENGLNVLKGSTVERIPALENMTVNNIVFDKIGNMYIKSGPEIYRLKPNAKEPVLFASAKYLISGDKDGEVYFFEPTKRYIYQVDSDTDQLVNVGAYDQSRDGRKRPNLKEFVFDKNNNLIFKDKWSTLYYKSFPAKCTFEYEADRARTRITKL